MHSSVNTLLKSNMKNIKLANKNGKDGKEDCCYHVQC